MNCEALRAITRLLRTNRDTSNKLELSGDICFCVKPEASVVVVCSETPAVVCSRCMQAVKNQKEHCTSRGGGKG